MSTTEAIKFGIDKIEDQRQEIERLTAELDKFNDLQFCDCCEGLFEHVTSGDHNQCDTCTELANVSTEVSRLKVSLEEYVRLDRAGKIERDSGSPEPKYNCGDCGKPIIDTGSPIPGTDVLGYQRFCDECIAADLSRHERIDYAESIGFEPDNHAKFPDELMWLCPPVTEQRFEGGAQVVREYVPFSDLPDTPDGRESS